jgi:hypothetical protein
MKTNCRILLTVILLSASAMLSAQKTLVIDKREADCDSIFTIAVRTQNISNVVALQGSIAWDTGVVTYNSISFGSAAIQFSAANVNVTSAPSGHLSFLWFDDNVQGRTVADSTALFSLTFARKGAGNGRGYVNFSSSPTQLEMDTTDTNGNPVNNRDAVFENGFVTTPYAYQFTGSGNWSLAANWINNKLPPSVLGPCSQIVINPAGSSVCLLDVPQSVMPGAAISVTTGKRLLVPGNIAVD